MERGHERMSRIPEEQRLTVRLEQLIANVHSFRGLNPILADDTLKLST